MNYHYKIMFSLTLMLGTIITLSSYSWIGMWMGLEINLLSIIPLMNNNKNLLTSESSLKYFITQTIASSVILYSLISISILKTHMINPSNEPLTMMLNSALLMKLGAAPFHFWFPEIIDGLNWLTSLTMMTWQKIAPSIILSSTMKNCNLIYLSIISSLIVGGLMGINQTSLRKILSYSSINHLGWMLTAITLNMSTWLNYFLIYSFISMNLILIFKSVKIFFMNQLFILKNNLLKMTFLLNFLSMGGVPPFLGFLPKWMILNQLVKTNLTLAITMVIITLVTLFLYIRTIIPMFTLNTSESKLKLNTKSQFSFWMMNWINITMLVTCTLWFNI